jgi:hypothetical protein
MLSIAADRTGGWVQAVHRILFKIVIGNEPKAAMAQGGVAGYNYSRRSVATATVWWCGRVPSGGTQSDRLNLQPFFHWAGRINAGLKPVATAIAFTHRGLLDPRS